MSGPNSPATEAQKLADELIAAGHGRRLVATALLEIGTAVLSTVEGPDAGEAALLAIMQKSEQIIGRAQQNVDPMQEVLAKAVIEHAASLTAAGHSPHSVADMLMSVGLGYQEALVGQRMLARMLYVGALRWYKLAEQADALHAADTTKPAN